MEVIIYSQQYQQWFFCIFSHFYVQSFDLANTDAIALAKKIAHWT